MKHIDPVAVAKYAHLPINRAYICGFGESVVRRGSHVHIDLPDLNLYPWEVARLIKAMREAETDAQAFLIAERSLRLEWKLKHGKTEEKAGEEV